MNVETANSNPSNTTSRCQHQFENGTRCRLPIMSTDSAFCPRHARLGENQPIEQDLTAKLFKNSQDFQTAQGVTSPPGNLSVLFAKNPPPPPLPPALAYITTLPPPTPPAIDSDHLKGVKDPTKLPLTANAPAVAAFVV